MIISKMGVVKIGGESVSSPFWPSEMAMFDKCPGVVLLKDDFKPHEITTAGIKAHEIVEKAVTSYIETGIITKIDIPEILDDDKGFIKDYYKFMIEEHKKDEWLLYAFETYVTGNFYHYVIGGKPDFFTWDGKVLTIADLKCGFKPQYEGAEKQLLFYAVCIGAELKLDMDAKIKLILWTRYGVKKYYFTYADALVFKNETLKKMLNLKFNPGEACKECYKFSICKAGQDKAESAFKELEKNPKAVKNYKNSIIIKKYLDECEKIVLKRYKEGKTIKNFNVYETEGRKYWIKSNVKDLMKDSKMTEIKLISVRDALKIRDDLTEGVHYNRVPTVVIKAKEEK